MRRIAVVLLVTACACGWLVAQGSAMEPKDATAAAFSVTPAKNSFTQGEAVQLRCRLTNTGQTALIVDGNFALGNSVHPAVTGPQGKEINWSGSFNARQPAFQTLAPAASLTRIICLNCGARDPFKDPFGQTGTYTARLEYSSSAVAAQAGNFPNAVPLKQVLKADPFHFQVSQAAVAFTAQPAQPVFRVGEPVIFHFRLQNRTNQAVLAAYDLSLENAVRLRVINENGSAVAWTGRAVARTPMLSTVSAGESISSAYPITPTDLFGTIVAGCNIQEPGTYTAYAVYMIDETFNVLQAYVGLLPNLIVPGPIPAPPVKFTVKRAKPESSSAE